MGLSGEITTMPVTDLLQWIEVTLKTGIVEFRRHNEWKKIFFQNGQILFVSSSKENEKIGRFLINRGCLQEKDLYDCLMENERTGKKLTEILETRGLISHDELYKQVLLLIKEMLFDLFLWKEGNFQFNDRKLPAAAKGPLALIIGQIIFDVLARIDESRRYPKKETPGEDQAVKTLGRKNTRGRAVLKVNDKKFTLPGSYERSDITGFRKVKEEEKEEKKD
jgi:hypothetical protein